MKYITGFTAVQTEIWPCLLQRALPASPITLLLLVRIARTWTPSSLDPVKSMSQIDVGTSRGHQNLPSAAAYDLSAHSLLLARSL